VLLGLMGCVGGWATAESWGANILFIGETSPPAGGDPSMIDHLEELGHTVTYELGIDTTGEDVAGFDLLVMSSTNLTVNVRDNGFDTIPEFDFLNEVGLKIFDNALAFALGETDGIAGDFDGSGVLDAADIDDLTAQSAKGTNPGDYDLNGDTLVNEQDVRVWVKDLFVSWVGDANLDHEFNSSDLVTVLASGTYEADVDAVWSTGDFNGDGRANSTDLVAALADGGYEQGRPAANAVPEPTGSLLLASGMAALLIVATRGSRVVEPHAARV
jgi:hypothetical protein